VKSRLQILAVAAIGIACLVFLFQRLFPNEERRIRKRLDGLASLVASAEGGSTARGLLAADRLRDYLTSDIEIEIEVPGERRQTFSGRQDIIRAALAARAAYGGLKVAFLDVRVTLGPGNESASVSTTVRASQPGQRDVFYQEMKLTLQQEDRQWRVRKAETVKSLQL